MEVAKMLVSFSIKNFKSFYKEASLDMEAQQKIKKRIGLNTFTAGNVQDTVKKETNDDKKKTQVEKMELLKSSFIYGKNAAGKSNFLKGVKAMQKIMFSSLRPNIKESSFNPENNLNIPEFQLNEKASTEPVEFEIEFIVHYQGELCKFLYGFGVLKNKIDSEWLYITKSRQSRVFERVGEKIAYLNSTYKKYFEEYKKHLTPNNLFLTTINALNKDEQNPCMIIANYFRGIHIIDFNHPNIETIEFLDKKPKMRQKIKRFIFEFDQNIDDLFLDITPIKDTDNRKGISNTTVRRTDSGFELIDIMTKHRKYSDDGHYRLISKNSDEFESEGTKKLFALAAPIVFALEHGQVVFVDELDSNLHPLIVEKLIEKFNSITGNPRNAQFICNTHNSLILDHDSLRKDQFWFVDKNEMGESELYRLIDFDGNVETNTMKKYLLGNFDGIPRFSDSA